jgi:hypothetical protein
MPPAVILEIVKLYELQDYERELLYWADLLENPNLPVPLHRDWESAYAILIEQQCQEFMVRVPKKLRLWLGPLGKVPFSAQLVIYLYLVEADHLLHRGDPQLIEHLDRSVPKTVFLLQAGQLPPDHAIPMLKPALRWLRDLPEDHQIA